MPMCCIMAVSKIENDKDYRTLPHQDHWHQMLYKQEYQLEISILVLVGFRGKMKNKMKKKIAHGFVYDDFAHP